MSVAARERGKERDTTHTQIDGEREGLEHPSLRASLPQRERLSHRDFLGIWGVSDEHFEHVVDSVEGKRLEIG